jgi:hypothetical protein
MSDAGREPREYLMPYLPPRTTPRVVEAVQAAGGVVRNMIALAPEGMQWVAYGYHLFEVPPPGASPEAEAEAIRNVARGFEPAAHHTLEGLLLAVELMGGEAEYDQDSGIVVLWSPEGSRWAAVADDEIAHDLGDSPAEDRQDLIDEMMSQVRRGLEPVPRRRRPRPRRP